MNVGDYLQQHRRRIAVALLGLLVAVLVVLSDSVYALIDRGLDVVEDLLFRHPVAGLVTFVGLSALSAMITFVSTAVLVPVGITVWGELGTMGLLWSGWLLGGAIAYSIGRFLGRGIVRLLTSKEQMDRYEGSINRRLRWPAVFLFQLALPSEVPGYLLGIVRYPFPRFLLALALAELPFAAGAVYLGKGFLERNYVMMFLLGLAGILLIVGALAAWHHRQRQVE
jgi:uncharacterized membrane protein YdjX (TVP38/TMEM64 family)